MIRVPYGLSRRLAHFDFKGVDIFEPAALWETSLEVRYGGHSGFSLALFVLRIGFPIERRISLWAVHVRELLEFRFRLVVAVLVQVLAAVVVQFLQPVQPFLGTVARFLFLILELLRVLERVRGLHAGYREPMCACTDWRQQHRDGEPDDAAGS